MKKVLIAVLCLGFVLAIACSAPQLSPQVCPESVVKNIRQHSVSIAVYYVMGENTYKEWMAEKATITLKTPVKAEEPYKAIAVIGSGTILKNNHVITARHLVDPHYGVNFSKIYVFIYGLDHAVEADLVCKSEEGCFSDDYAIFRLKENVGLPGLKIAKTQPALGNMVVFTGSPGGVAFFTRFGYVTDFQWFFRKDEISVLHLSQWESFAYQTVYPGGPGDSGGNICNVQGELVGVMYCGIENYSEQYIFSNPLSMIWDFLKKNGLEDLGQ